MLIIGNNSAEVGVCESTAPLPGSDRAMRYAIVEALSDRLAQLEHIVARLRLDIDVLQDVGLSGELSRVRHESREIYAIMEALRHAAAEMKSCGERQVQYECRNGHVSYAPFRCNKVCCPECARRRSAKVRSIYTGRALELLRQAPKGVRPRLVTLPLRHGEDESLKKAFGRCQQAIKSTLRVLFGVPASAHEWAMYFELEPISASEIEQVPAVTLTGKRRKHSTRIRKARTERRRKVKAAKLRKVFGALTHMEFGERLCNVHGHCLVLGGYVQQVRLAEAWRLATAGSSHIADIREAKTVSGGVTEVAKYMTKFGSHSPETIVKLYEAVLVTGTGKHGEPTARVRRRLEALGSLRRRSALEEDPLPPACDQCGEPIRPVGVIEGGLWRMGVRSVSEADRFGLRSHIEGGSRD